MRSGRPPAGRGGAELGERRRRALGRRLLALLAALLLLGPLLGGAALAERIEIDASGDPASRLEIRRVALPDGTEAELYVLEGDPLVVTIGERVLRASYVEFDPANRVLRVVGEGAFDTGDGPSVAASDLVIDLADEGFRGRDVLIVTPEIDVRGARATRVPGQIDVADGSFSPCSRCSDDPDAVEDYGFRAARLLLYPGDRLVAYDAEILVRGRGVATLPVLVLPLAQDDRAPRLEIAAGTATERARVEATWPYAAGPDAYGTFTVRWYADVDPAAGGGIEEALLGGRVRTSYLGGALDHRFYDERGAGRLQLGYVPPFLDAAASEGRRRPQWTVLATYATVEGIDGPELALALERDDARRDRMLEADVLVADRLPIGGPFGAGRAGAEAPAFGVEFRSRLAWDLDPDDRVPDPSWDARSEPRRTFAAVLLRPEGALAPLGPLRVRDVALDVGVLEDQANLLNRSSAGERLVVTGRVAQAFAVELDPLALWRGATVSGANDFEGYYYGTGERLIEWSSRATLRQDLGGIGELSAVWTRDVGEGETPFAFDQLRVALRRRVALALALDLAPAPWLAFEADGGWVFEDDRRPDEVGPQPLSTRLTLFGDRRWIDLSFANAFDLDDGDPGRLEAALSLRVPDPALRAELDVVHVQDLEVEPDRLTGAPSDETVTTWEAAYGLPTLSVELSTAWRPNPPPPEEPGGPRDHRGPLELAVQLGTLLDGDRRPGLRVSYARDPDERRAVEAGWRGAFELGPVAFTAEQTLPLDDRAGTGAYAIRIEDVLALEARGFGLVRPAWLGLEPPPRPRDFEVELHEDGPRERWSVRYRWRRVPGVDGAPATIDRRSVEAEVDVEPTGTPYATFQVTASARLRLRGDDVERTFLDRASAEFGVDVLGRVGLQGTLGYSGVLIGDEITRARLALEEVALTVRATDELIVGAVLDDVWDFAGTVPAESPWNLQPTLFVAWDRCCWALYGELDTADGSVRIVLTTPGGDEGLAPEFSTPLRLPGREP